MRVATLDIGKKQHPLDERLGVYHNGEDGNYAAIVERSINNSPTAKSVTNILRKFIFGRGIVDELGTYIVNDKHQTLQKFLYNVVSCFSTHNGVFIHVNYNANYKIRSLDVLPYTNCLVGKKDDVGYSGKICICPKDKSGGIDKNKIIPIDVFNPNPIIVRDQIKKAKGVENYKGQIFFFNPATTIYPLAHLDAVLRDADSEYRAGIYKNKLLTGGFFGKNIVITHSMIDSALTTINESHLSADQLDKKRAQINESEELKKSLQSFLGVENVDAIMHVQLDNYNNTELDKLFKVIEVGGKIDDKTFAYTEQSVRDNIIRCIGVPSVLVNTNDSGMFGNSGELLKYAKVEMQDKTEEYRLSIEREVLTPLVSAFNGVQVADVKIQPLIDV